MNDRSISEIAKIIIGMNEEREIKAKANKASSDERARSSCAARRRIEEREYQKAIESYEPIGSTNYMPVRNEFITQKQRDKSRENRKKYDFGSGRA